MTAPPETAVCSSTGQYLTMDKEREVDICFLMLKWFDMLGIITLSAARGGGGDGHRSPASECHQIRSREVEGQKCSTCHPGARTHHLYAPAKRRPKLWGVGWRIRGQRFLCKMRMLLQYGWGMAAHWPYNVTCLCRAARGPSQRANAGQYKRGGSGGRSVCNSHMLSPVKAAIEVDKEREKRGVMVMPQLMEISCQGWGTGGPGGLGRGCADDTEASTPVFRNAAAFRSREQVHPCFSAILHCQRD